MNFLAFCIVLLAVGFMSCQVTLSDQALWSKYRVRLAYEIAKRYCGGSVDCPAVSSSEFQMLTTPTLANWHQDGNQLAKDVVGFAPAWATSYKPRDTSHDGVISELYKKYLLESRNLDQYKNFMAQQPTSDGIFYSWYEPNDKLANFVARSAPRSGQTGFQMGIDLNTEETLRNSWATLGGVYTGQSGFIRTYTAEQTSSDAQKWKIEDLETHFDEKPNSDSEFIFGRGRTVVHHVYQTKTVVVNTKRFEFTLSATDIATIDVMPGGWCNKIQFINDKTTLARMGFNGPNGLFPLFPKTIIVAYKPRVDLVVSKSVYEQIKSEVDNPAVLGFLVGGARFLKPSVRALYDDGAVSFYGPNDDRSSADSITFKRIKPEPTPIKPPTPVEPKKPIEEPKHPDLEGHLDEKIMKSPATPIMPKRRHHKKIIANNQQADGETEWFWRRRRSTESQQQQQPESDSESQFLFRRRTRHVTEVHTTTVTVPEGDYQISWVSNSDQPQILAVINERM